MKVVIALVLSGLIGMAAFGDFFVDGKTNYSSIVTSFLLFLFFNAIFNGFKSKSQSEEEDDNVEYESVNYEINPKEEVSDLGEENNSNNDLKEKENRTDSGIFESLDDSREDDELISDDHLIDVDLNKESVKNGFASRSKGALVEVYLVLKGLFNLVIGVVIVAIVVSWVMDSMFDDNEDYPNDLSQPNMVDKVDNPLEDVKELSWKSEQCKMENFPILYDAKFFQFAMEMQRELASKIGTTEEDMRKQYEMFKNFSVLYCARNWDRRLIRDLVVAFKKNRVSFSSWHEESQTMIDNLPDARYSDFADFYLTVRSFQILFRVPDDLYPEGIPPVESFREALKGFDFDRSLNKKEVLELSISGYPKIDFYVQPFSDITLSELIGTGMDDLQVSPEAPVGAGLLGYSLHEIFGEDDITLASKELKLTKKLLALYVNLHLAFVSNVDSKLDIYLVTDNLKPVCDGVIRESSAFYCPAENYIYVYQDRDIDADSSEFTISADFIYLDAALPKLFHEVSHYFTLTDLRSRVPFLAEVVATGEGEYFSNLIVAGIQERIMSNNKGYQGEYKKLESLIKSGDLSDLDNLRGFVNSSREGAPLTKLQESYICRLRSRLITDREVFNYLKFGKDFERTDRQYEVAWAVGHAWRVGQYIGGENSNIVDDLENVASGMEAGDRKMESWSDYISPIVSRVNGWISDQEQVECY